ncbi:oligosaccharide flippase family protein [Photobacterium phosphoreum]|uniref:oligosaccharide flippase family protein n=1 Tax=Photobacterium phosphoreum TaxID=659 RepID=UPI0039AF30C5
MNKQIIKNILFNSLGFISNMVLMLALTPYLVDNLGVSAYGFIPLAAIFTSYIGIVTESLTISINRNLTKALQKKEKEIVKEVYNTSLITVFVIISIVLFLITYPIQNLDEIISIPVGISNDVKLLFLLLILSFLLSLISAVYSVAMYATNRIDLMQVNNLIRNIVRAFFIFLFFNYYSRDLISVGYGTLIGNVFSFIFSYIYKCKLIPYMKFEIKYFKLEKVKYIMNMGGWLLINQVGFVLFMKVDLLIINKFLGSEQSGFYAIAIQFNDVLRIFAGIISGVLGPAILILYSQNKRERMVDLTYGFVKLLSVSIAIPIVLICVWSDDILKYWMGGEYVFLSPLIWILTLPLIINIGIQPLFSIQVAMNKVKIPALMNVLFGLIGVLFSIYLLLYFNFGFYSVAISSVIMLTLKNAVFTPIYTAKILNINVMKFMTIHIKTLLFSLISISILFLVKKAIIICSVYELVLVLVISGIVLLMLSLFFYSEKEREFYLNFIKEKV